MVFGVVLMVAFVALAAMNKEHRKPDPSDQLAAEREPAPKPTMTTPTKSCGPEAFSLSKITYEPLREHVTITGLVRHACPYAAGVQLKWTAYNKDGTVAFSEDFWPASVVNIQPDTPYAFEMMHAGSPAIVRYEVAPSGTRVW